jgi:hypothetical protein
MRIVIDLQGIQTVSRFRGIRWRLLKLFFAIEARMKFLLSLMDFFRKQFNLFVILLRIYYQKLIFVSGKRLRLALYVNVTHPIPGAVQLERS